VAEADVSNFDAPLSKKMGEWAGEWSSLLRPVGVPRAIISRYIMLRECGKYIRSAQYSC